MKTKTKMTQRDIVLYHQDVRHFDEGTSNDGVRNRRIACENR